jgi:hypothetical protein
MGMGISVTSSLAKKETIEEAAENFTISKKWLNGGAEKWVQHTFIARRTATAMYKASPLGKNFTGNDVVVDLANGAVNGVFVF